MADDLAAALPGLLDAACANDVLELERAWNDVQGALDEIADQALVVEELLGSRGQVLAVLQSSIERHGELVGRTISRAQHRSAWVDQRQVQGLPSRARDQSQNAQ
jgi:hypothetical protein